MVGPVLAETDLVSELPNRRRWKAARSCRRCANSAEVGFT
jgi:hypothetical protein